jgi:hypothetical protein
MLAVQKRMRAVMAENGRTEFRWLHCDLVDPLQTDAVKWAGSPLAAPVSIDRDQSEHYKHMPVDPSAIG